MATQVTVITGEGSTTYSVSTGARGPAGPASNATPAGSTGSVQLNNAGALAADSGLVYTGTGNLGTLKVGGGRIYMDATTGAIQANNIAIGGSNGVMPFANVAPAAGNVGSLNVSIGSGNFQAITTGQKNVACGSYSLLSLTEGSNNLAIGNNTLYDLVDGQRNVALGSGAGGGITSGDDNIMIASAPADGTANCQIAIAGTPDGPSSTVIGYDGKGNEVPTTKTRFIGNTIIWGDGVVGTSSPTASPNNRTSLVQTASGTAKTITLPNVTGKLPVYTDTPAEGKILTATDASGAATWQVNTGVAPTNATVNTAINTDPAETRYALSVERKQNFGAAIQNLRGQTSKNLRVVTFGDSLVAQGTPLNLSGVIPSAGGSCEAEGSINVAGATTIVNDWTNPGGRYANIPALGTRRFARYSPSASAAPFHHASIFKVYYVKNTGTFKLRSSTGIGKTISIAPTILGTTVTVTTSAAHGFAVGNEVTIQGIVFTSGTDPNGVVTVLAVPNTTSFTYTLTGGVGPYTITSGGTSTFPTAAIFTDVGKPITAASLSGTTVTIICPAHGFAAGDEVIIQNITGFSGTTPNGKFAIATIVNVNSFTYTLTGGSGTYTVTSNPKAVAVVNTAGTAGTIGVYTVAMTPNGSNFYRVDVECLTGTVKILYVHALVDTSAGRDSYHLSCLGLGGSFDSEWVQCLQPNWTTVLTAIDPHLIVFKAADFHIGNKTLAGDWATVLTRIRTAAPNAVILLIDNHPWQDNPDPAVDNTAWSAGLKAYAALYAPMVQFVECRKFFPSYAKMVEFGFIGESDGIHLSDGIGRLFESSLVLDHVSTLTVAPHVNELPNIKIFSRLAGIIGTVKSSFQSGPEWAVTGDLTNANGYIGMFNQLGTGSNPNVGAHLINFATAATNFRVSGGLALGVTRASHQLLVQSRVNNRIIIGNLGDAETALTRDADAQLEVFGNSAAVATLTASSIAGQTANIFEVKSSATLAASGTLATAFGPAGALITVPVAHPMPYDVTISIASPCVITKAAHGLFPNQQIVFTTTGALPTGLALATRYFVLSTNFTTGTFQVSATLNGTAINTSGTQSGVHTATPIVYTQSPTTSLTTTAAGQLITLANGVAGQIKTITHVSTGATFTAILTPDTKTGYTNITFTNIGDTVTLQYYAVIGWVIVSILGATVA